MNHKTVLFLAFISIQILGCGRNTEIANFDSEAWKSDKNGCEKARIQMMSRLEELIYELKGMEEAQLLKVLGKADKTELYERGQRFMIYDISPDETCQIDYQGQQIDLILRLNALGIVSEANLQSYADFNAD